MLDKRIHHPSPSVRLKEGLLPLRMALIAAERESPARPRRLDPNERLALQLIARMQAGYSRTLPFMVWREEPRGMAGGHAG